MSKILLGQLNVPYNRQLVKAMLLFRIPAWVAQDDHIIHEPSLAWAGLCGGNCKKLGFGILILCRVEQITRVTLELSLHCTTRYRVYSQLYFNLFLNQAYILFKRAGSPLIWIFSVRWSNHTKQTCKQCLVCVIQTCKRCWFIKILKTTHLWRSLKTSLLICGGDNLFKRQFVSVLFDWLFSNTTHMSGQGVQHLLGDDDKWSEGSECSNAGI